MAAVVGDVYQDKSTKSKYVQVKYVGPDVVLVKEPSGRTSVVRASKFDARYEPFVLEDVTIDEGTGEVTFDDALTLTYADGVSSLSTTAAADVDIPDAVFAQMKNLAKLLAPTP